MRSRVDAPAAPAVRREVEFGPRGYPWAGPRYNETMPFPGHRNQREVREDEERQAFLRALPQ